jgi:hypothetical protein
MLNIWPCNNNFHIQVLNICFFPTPPIKLKLGLKTRGILLIATHLDQLNQLANYKQWKIIKYNMIVFIIFL